MPTYEYACPTCGIVEAFQSIKEAALTRCPQCKKAKVTRMISGGAGVIFKGSGFWETDYNRSGEYQKKAKDEAKKPAADAPAAAKPADPPPKPETKALRKPLDPTPSATTPPTKPTS